MREKFEGKPEMMLNPQKQNKYSVEEFKAQIAEKQAEIVAYGEKAEIAIAEGKMRDYDNCQDEITTRTKELVLLKEYARRKEFGRWVLKKTGN